MGKSFDPSRYFNSIELIRKARAGDARALELIINTVINWPLPDGTPMLTIYARKQAQRLRTWDEQDIIAVMRTIIWNAVTGIGDKKSRYWDESRSMSFHSCCFYWLRQDVAHQYNIEHQLRNKMELTPLPSGENELLDRKQSSFEDAVLMRCTLEKYWHSFTQKQQDILSSLFQGLTAREIAQELKLSPPTIYTYLREIRKHLKK